MSVDWISTTVGEYSPFTYGKAIKKADQLNGGIPVYGSNGVYAFSAEALVKQHAVIIGRKGSVGKVHLSTKPCWISDTAFHTTKNTIEEAYFVYYLLSSLGLEDMNTDAAVPGLNRNNAHRLEIKIPNSVEGRIALVAPLITLDKKIELNRQTNQTLEQIAQAIFKSWFVDFEPTRAKVITKAQGAEPATQELAAQAIISGAITLEQLQGYAEESVEESAQQREQESLSTRLQKAINEKLSQASANPLNATTAEQLIATAALFPNELVESELGEVPEGWELKPFSEYAKVTKGKTPPRKESHWFSNDINDVKWVSIRDLGVSGAYVLSTSEYLTEEAVSKFNVRRIPHNTVLLSFKMTVGRVAITDGEMLSNEAIAHFKLANDCHL